MGSRNEFILFSMNGLKILTDGEILISLKKEKKIDPQWIQIRDVSDRNFKIIMINVFGEG